MQSIREETEKLEEILVGENGVRAANTIGRVIVEDEDSVRTAFQRDVDRITHSKAFRRLKQKTQVFLDPEGDHYRTRLTHTLEVTRIARTMARALRFNEDLTEAIGLGHDLGHTPFGHAGERALNVIMEADGGFRHYEQSLRVVDTLEKNGRGLNLTYEVRDGIVRHTCDPLAATFEGQAVRLADKIAYINHDVDDAIVTDVIGEGCASGRLRMSPEVGAAVDTFHEFLYENVYRNPTVKGEERKVQGLINGIFEYYFKNPEKMSEEYLAIADRDGLTRAVCDYVAGMTDSYAIAVHKDIFIPMAWTVK